MSHSNIWLWVGKFYQSKSQNENEGLAKKKKKKDTIQEQREVACTRAKTARSISFSQILHILSKQELSYRWDVTCMFLDANQSETSSVNRTQY